MSNTFTLPISSLVTANGATHLHIVGLRQKTMQWCEWTMKNIQTIGFLCIPPSSFQHPAWVLPVEGYGCFRQGSPRWHKRSTTLNIQRALWLMYNRNKRYWMRLIDSLLKLFIVLFNVVSRFLFERFKMMRATFIDGRIQIRIKAVIRVHLHTYTA